VELRRTSWSDADAPAPTDRRIPPAAVAVLNYHSIGGNVSARHAPFAITAAQFAEHLDLITDAGLRTVTMAECAAARAAGHAEAGRCVVLTFDDGFGDFAEVAAPLLLERGMVASAFVPTAFVAGAGARGAWRQMTWREIRDVDAAGIEIGSHGHRHVALDLDRRVARDELDTSRAILEDQLQRSVRSVAYPFGWCRPWVLDLATELGYTAGCTCDHALSLPSDHPLALSRLRVMHDTTADVLARWLTADGVRPSGRGERLVALVHVRRVARVEQSWP
jgi:peptidoglycan/xylan/chitin deacetylase (PgdA/CDA1 family)